MRAIKLVCLSALVLVLGAFAATGAFAEEGFLPTPQAANILGGRSIFETESGSQFECERLDESSVKFETDKRSAVTLHWLGCKGLFAFDSLGTKSGEVLIPVILSVCLDPTNAAGKLLEEFGVAAEVEGTLHFEIPSEGVLGELKGTLLGVVLTSGKARLFNIEISGAKGKQTAAECLQGKTKIAGNLLASINEGASSDLSVNMTSGLLQFPEETELMDG